MRLATLKPFLYGILASLLLLGAYFSILTLVSGWSFAQDQFKQFWYFIVSLAVGFGVQVGLYTHLRNRIASMHGEGKMLGVTGTTSAAAMVSCCAHYLVNIFPLIGTAGVLTVIAQYQVQFFWLGLAMNLAGIFYIASRIIKVKTL